MATDYAVLKKGGFMRQKQKNKLLFKTSCSWRKSYGKTTGKDC